MRPKSLILLATLAILPAMVSGAPPATLSYQGVLADEYGEPYGGRGTYAWWEQVLKASCQESVTVHVQVIRNGQPASSVVTVKTTGDCDKNLILIHFTQNY